MMNLSIDEILLIHQKLMDATGGLPGVRDLTLLESAVYSTIQTFGGEELYPLVEQKAAHLAFAITKNHPFIDGNKRTGILTMLMTLKLNGIAIHYTQAELIALGLSVADGTTQYNEILEWISQHLD